MDATAGANPGTDGMTNKRPKRSKTSNGFVSSVWEFPHNESVAYAGHSIYRWYGTLPGPLVRRLLDLYADPESPTCDPMCGGGTTLVEARLRGLAATGCDVNPLAVLIARTKLTPIQDIQRIVGNVTTKTPRKLDSTRDALEQFSAEYPYAAKWFREDTLRDLLNLGIWLCRYHSPSAVSRVLLLAFSASVREVAQVDPRCTHHLVTKLKDYINPAEVFSSRLSDMARQIAEIPQMDSAICETDVQQASFDSQAIRSSQLVITHPPYLGVIHYNLIHRLSTDILGFLSSTMAIDALSGLDFDPVRIKSVDESTDNDAHYSMFLDSLTGRLSETTVPGGRAIIILGDARHKGMLRHPFTEAIVRMEQKGFQLEENFIWLLQNNGGMHVLRRGHHIDHNYIMVFRRSE